MIVHGRLGANDEDQPPYSFTSSTIFPNPAITIARSLANSFADIAPHDVPLFIGSQRFGAACAAQLAKGRRRSMNGHLD